MTHHHKLTGFARDGDGRWVADFAISDHWDKIVPILAVTQEDLDYDPHYAMEHDLDDEEAQEVSKIIGYDLPLNIHWFVGPGDDSAAWAEFTWCRENLKNGWRIDWYWLSWYSNSTPPIMIIGYSINTCYATEQIFTLLANDENDLLLAKLRWL